MLCCTVPGAIAKKNSTLEIAILSHIATMACGSVVRAFAS